MAAEPGAETTASVRLDKWLWAARFFKTRSLAAEAVSGGKVHLNSERTRPARPVRVGDEISVQRGIYETVVVVRGLREERRPAAEAVLLYEETAQSRERRERMRLEARLQEGMREAGRPSKRDRRQLRRARDAGPL